MAYANRDTAAWAVGLLDLDPDATVLEVGAGPGVGVQLAAERTPRGRILALDPAPQMLEMARTRNRELLDAGQASLTRAVAEHLPYADGVFDAVLAVNTLPLWTDPDAGLAEIRRAIAPDGRLAVAFTPRFADSAEGVPDRLTRAGFHRARRQRSEHGICVLAEPMTDDQRSAP